MIKRKLPKGLRKHIRLKKARIRRGVLSIEEQKAKIERLYKNLFEPATPKKQPEKPVKKEKTAKKKTKDKKTSTPAKVATDKPVEREGKKKNVKTAEKKKKEEEQKKSERLKKKKKTEKQVENKN